MLTGRFITSYKASLFFFCWSITALHETGCGFIWRHSLTVHPHQLLSGAIMSSLQIFAPSQLIWEKKKTENALSLTICLMISCFLLLLLLFIPYHFHLGGGVAGDSQIVCAPSLEIYNSCPVHSPIYINESAARSGRCMKRKAWRDMEVMQGGEGNWGSEVEREREREKKQKRGREGGREEERECEQLLPNKATV